MSEEYDKAEAKVNRWKSCRTIEDVLIEVKTTNNISNLSLFKAIIFKNCGFSEEQKKEINDLLNNQANYLGAKHYLEK